MTTTDASLTTLPECLLLMLIVCGSLALASFGLLIVRRYMKTPEQATWREGRGDAYHRPYPLAALH
jgi:hypothetical protein